MFSLPKSGLVLVLVCGDFSHCELTVNDRMKGPRDQDLYFKEKGLVEPRN